MGNPFDKKKTDFFLPFVRGQIDSMEVGDVIKIDHRGESDKKVRRSVQASGEKLGVSFECKIDGSGSYWVKRVK